MKPDMLVVSIVLTSVALIVSATHGMPTGIQNNPFASATAQQQQKETLPSKSMPNDDGPKAIESLKQALQMETVQQDFQNSNPINADEVVTPRARRSYKLPGNLDLSQFYTPQGIYDAASSEEGNSEMTKQELEYEREKFQRLLSILESGSAGAAGDQDATKVVIEPVIALMSNHPSRNRGRNSNRRPTLMELDESGSRRGSDEETEWLDDPIPIHRHRVTRRTNTYHPAGDEAEFSGYYNPRQVYKRGNSYMVN